MSARKFALLQAAAVLVGMVLLIACGDTGTEKTGESAAGVGVSSTDLSLQVLTNTCGANQVQDFFNVTNNGTTPVTVSDITIKLWADDTSAPALAAQINTGGCLLNSAGSCVHQVTGVTAIATPFSPACGSDPNHQANWEITISSTDHTALGAGLEWTNIQSALHLANFTNFSPGTGQWYSSCVPGTSFTNSTHFAVYVGGNLVTASTGVPPSCRAPHGSQPITGEIPPGVGEASLAGSLPGSTELTLAVGLPLRNQTDLQTFLKNLYDPKSPQYRKYLTPDAFAAAYGATTNDYNNLIAFLQLNGLSVVSTYPSRDLVLVKGTAAAVKATFFLTLNLYKRPDGSTFFAPANEPSLNSGISVLYVSGLNSFAVAKRALGGGGTGPLGCTPNPAGGSYAGTDFRNIYFPGCTALDGTGQTIGLLEFSDFYTQDVTDYETVFNLGAPTVTRIGVPTATALPALQTPLSTACPGLAGTGLLSVPTDCVTSGSISSSPFTTAEVNTTNEGEVALDLQMLVAMAPKAGIRVYEASTPFVGGLAILNAMASEPTATRPSVISSSWTWTPTIPDPSLVNAFIQLAVQGQSFFQSSGDTGAYAPGSGLSAVPDPIIESSLMTVVGGTQLTTTGAGTSVVYASEQAWNDTAAIPACNIANCSTLSGQCGCNSVGSGGLCNGYVVCSSATTGISFQPIGTMSTGTMSCASAPYASLPIPSYQSDLPGYLTAAATAAGQFSTTTRMIPDVSMVADQLAVFTGLVSTLTATTVQVYDPLEVCSGGTSAATPLWAGIAAMANQQQAQLPVPQGSVGFVNPTLYALATASQAAYSGNTGAFHDVAAGNIVYTGNVTSPNSFQAVAGYDLATGLGSPNGTSCNPLNILPPQTNGSVLAAGAFFTCAIRSGGNVLCWGLNDIGQLGDGTVGSGATLKRPTPAPVKETNGMNLTGATYLATGGNHSCVLFGSGQAKCWGDNALGELGDGNTTPPLMGQPNPVQVNGLTGAIAIAAGGSRVNIASVEATCALLSGGGVSCWGGNTFGQLGNGNTTDQHLPVPVTGLSGAATSIALGAGHACAVIANGTVQCWGANDFGQLGDNSGHSQSHPVTVQGVAGATAVAAGEAHTCALLTDGTVLCWGDNEGGQLGDNSHTNQPLAVAAHGLTGAFKIAAGGLHTCALIASDGHMECWGDNAEGDLGIGTTTLPVPNFPQNVLALAPASALTAGFGHTCALLVSDGTSIDCWGDNQQGGELGDGTTTDRSTPVSVVFP